MIMIDAKENVLLIDFSYFFIYRYYALMSWFKMSETPFDEALFLEKYKKLFLVNIEKIIKKFKVKCHNTVLVGDCSRSNIWRNALFEKYKENREKLYEKSPINTKIFPIIYDDIIPALKKKGVQYVCVDTLEADDVVYGITQKISNNITILTNDNDYLQMSQPNIDIVNLPSFKSIKSRGLACPQKDLLCKILCGDPSDNIPSIMGKKQALKLLGNANVKQEVDNYIAKNNLEYRYELNSSLIDMSKIPQELLNNIIIAIYNDS
uniref:Ribonuclease H n=1 Tax=Pyramimonas orientalis virus TaxID=455367 RepID=A0A7M3UNU9_POV01|nr:ribonuclease H [Pyramimonas orientalis virus]